MHIIHHAYSYTMWLDFRTIGGTVPLWGIAWGRALLWWNKLRRRFYEFISNEGKVIILAHVYVFVMSCLCHERYATQCCQWMACLTPWTFSTIWQFPRPTGFCGLKTSYRDQNWPCTCFKGAERGGGGYCFSMCTSTWIIFAFVVVIILPSLWNCSGCNQI